jgi:hypothetical protein
LYWVFLFLSILTIFYCCARWWHIETLWYLKYFIPDFTPSIILLYPPSLHSWWAICSGWLWTMILLISASRVARIRGVSHWHQAIFVIAFRYGWHKIKGRAQPSHTSYRDPESTNGQNYSSASILPLCLVVSLKN